MARAARRWASAWWARGSSSATATWSPTRRPGFRVVGITSRTLESRSGSRGLRGIPRVYADVEALLDDPEIEVVDVAVPPAEQPGVIERILGASPARCAASWRRSRWRLRSAKPAAWSTRATRPASCSRSIRTCGMTTRCGRSKHLLDRGRAGRSGAGHDRDAGDPALDALGAARAARSRPSS